MSRNHKRAAGARAEAPRAGKGAQVPPGRKVISARGGKRGKPDRETGRRGDKAKAKPKSTKSTKSAAKTPLEKPWDASQMRPIPAEERFCQLYADGRYSGRSCYAQAFGVENEGSARTLAWKLLTNVDIKDRIEWLRKESLKNWSCEKEEVMKFLHSVIVTPVGYVDEESPLAQEVTRDLIEKGEDAPDVLKVKVKMPGKKDCAELLAKMQGWEKPKEVNLNLGYEPPSVAMDRAKAKGIDVVAILQKVGLLK